MTATPVSAPQWTCDDLLQPSPPWRLERFRSVFPRPRLVGRLCPLWRGLLSGARRKPVERRPAATGQRSEPGAPPAVLCGAPRSAVRGLFPYRPPHREQDHGRVEIRRGWALGDLKYLQYVDPRGILARPVQLPDGGGGTKGGRSDQHRNPILHLQPSAPCPTPVGHGEGTLED